MTRAPQRFFSAEGASVRALHTWTSHSATDVALGLAIASSAPGDWRMKAMLWACAGEQSHIGEIAHRLALVVSRLAEVACIRTTPEVVAAAVGDAMVYQLTRSGPSPPIPPRASRTEDSSMIDEKAWDAAMLPQRYDETELQVFYRRYDVAMQLLPDNVRAHRARIHPQGIDEWRATSAA